MQNKSQKGLLKGIRIQAESNKNTSEKIVNQKCNK